MTLRPRSIGTRLTLWYTSLLTLTFILLGGSAYGLLSYSLSRDMDAALRGVATNMVQRARQNRTSVVPPDVDALFRRFFGFSPLNPYFGLLDPRGRQNSGLRGPGENKIQISPETLHKAATGRPAFETVATQGPYPVRVLTMPVIEAGRVVNLVQVGMSMQTMHTTKQRFLMMMASVLPLGLLLAGGGGWLLARRALRPVDHMTRTTQRISGDHLDTRLPETGSGDELDRLARTLNTMLDRLDESFHHMRRFSSEASHELQTPLTILKGEMEVALSADRSPEEYQKTLHSCLEEIERISHLVEGLLLLSRADSGVMRLDVQPVDLKDLIEDVHAHMQIVARTHCIDLGLGFLTPCHVFGDHSHLKRLLINLVDNALKYTPAEGTVALSVKTDAPWAVISVSDSGIGISEENRQQIFNRFHRVTETRARDVQGVGLGLSIAQSIALAHQGRIEVSSEPGQGSTFWVYLPLQEGR